MSSSSEDENEGDSLRSYQSRAHKLVTLFIMTAGSANASQFPMMFIVYGGGLLETRTLWQRAGFFLDAVPFLLAYLAFLGAVAFPIMRLESNLAQFAGDGNRGIFSTVPLFIGLGYTMSLYAIVHMVGDSVPVSDQLLYLLGSVREAAWNDCPHGVVLAPNRTCYAPKHALSLCRTTRDRLVEAFRRQSLSQGIPAVGAADDEDLRVALVPPNEYHREMNACVPGLYNYLQPYQQRRPSDWVEEDMRSLSDIRAQPFLSLAAMWMLVFALARRGLTTAKRFLYAMVWLHLGTTVLLLVRGATLPGAMGGLSMILYADWSYAANLQMWCSALYVSLESFGVTGSMYLGIIRFNDFKNEYQRDVNFVLVADTATKGLRTAITFMFLGHLASTVGIDVRMLVGIESDFVVGIMPQAISLVPYHQLWSHVHCLWLLSTMLPKFLIVPDIVIEVLSAAQPFILLNRTLIHFFVCVCLLMVSIVVCSPGGAHIAAIIVHNHDQNLRFFMLFLESIVFLQFCGQRRLDVVCRMMTGRESSAFVKVCLASIIPLTIITLFSAKITSQRWPALGQYPIWIYGTMVWFDLVHLSCIPVFAVVLMNETHMTVSSCLMPLPTWVPVSWQDAMVYRQTLVVKGFDSDVKKMGAADKPRRGPKVVRGSSKKSKRANSSSSSSSTEFMASAMTFVSDRAYAETATGTSTLAARRAKMGVTSLSGTLHAPRRLSSLQQSVVHARVAKGHVLDDLNDPKRLFREAEGAGTSEPQFIGVSQMIAPSMPTFQESSQIAGVVLPSSDAAVEPPDQLSPEGSDISHKVNADHSHLHEKDLGSEAQSGREVPVSQKSTVHNEVMNAATSKIAEEKKSLSDVTLGSAKKSAASLPRQKSHESHHPLLETMTKSNGRIPSQQLAANGRSDALSSLERPEAVAAELYNNSKEKKDVSVEQPELETKSRQSRPSVQDLLLLNRPLPFSPQERAITSDVFIWIPCASKSSKEPPMQDTECVAQKITEIRSNEIKNGKNASINASVERLSRQQSFQKPAESLEKKEREGRASFGGPTKSVALGEKPKPGLKSPDAELPGGMVSGGGSGRSPRAKRAKPVSAKKQSKHGRSTAHKASAVTKKTAESTAGGAGAIVVVGKQAAQTSTADVIERKVGQSVEIASRPASAAGHSLRAATLRTATHKRGTALPRKSSGQPPDKTQDRSHHPDIKKSVVAEDEAPLREPSAATKTLTRGSVHKRVPQSEPRAPAEVEEKVPHDPAADVGESDKHGQGQRSLQRNKSACLIEPAEKRQPEVSSMLKEKRRMLEKEYAQGGVGPSGRALSKASTTAVELPGFAPGSQPQPAVKETQVKDADKRPVSAQDKPQKEQKRKHHKRDHKHHKKGTRGVGSPGVFSATSGVAILSPPTEPELQNAQKK